MNQSRLTRLRKLEEELDPEAVWLRTPGLYALLQAAEWLPPRDPWDAWEEGEAPLTGLGRLLAEARQWQREQEFLP